MNIFSALGDGEIFFYYSLVFFATGNLKAFSFTSITFVISLHFISWLKI